MSITAPYNFVPLNEEVFFPDWAEQVSHDIPFSDGESGSIDITIEAKSPIFIRNHSKDKENPSTEFCHFVDNNGAKQYYIPGSSIKGMIRSVLEIMSFGKIKVDEEKLKKPLSVRDMANQRELVGTANGCGFLVKKGEEFIIEDCGKIVTISHNDLPNDYANIKGLQTAKDKYERFGLRKVKYSTFKKMMTIGKKKIPKQMAKLDTSSNQEGYLVFTGDIKNKKHEFLFKSQTNKVVIDSEVFEDFSKVYFENEDSVDGQYWKNEFISHNVKIPIFYKKNKDTNKIEAIGLTQLFKLAYSKTLFDATKQKIDSQKLDLAEAIFGTYQENKALKGRVQFSHLKSTFERFEQEKEYSEILGTPNPTYYPSYIRQTNIQNGKVTKYVTLMDKGSKIAGYKRYPLQPNILSPRGGNENDCIRTKFKPLPQGSIFKGKIRFYNLKKAEIGALLSAITFHNKEQVHYHNIGMAKPLGYGKISIKLENFKYMKYSKKVYIDTFEQMMDSWEGKEYKKWIDSVQVKELFAMAHVANDTVLNYQLLENDKKKNEFAEDKKAKKYLLPYSQITRKKEIVFKNKEIKKPLSQDIIDRKVSKTKMNKAIQQMWRNGLGLAYHKNQITEFMNQNYKTTPSQTQSKLESLRSNEQFCANIVQISKFYKDNMSEENAQKLYQDIVNFSKWI